MPRSTRDSVHAGFARLAVVAALFCCCGTHPKVAPDTGATPERPRPQRQRRSAPDVHSETENAIREIAALRGWTPTLSVNVQVAPDGVIASSMFADARSQMSPSAQEAQARFLAAFGWVPFGFDMERDVFARFAHEVTGLYCVTTQQVLLSEHASPRLAGKALRHELVHAFQDARYGLAHRTRWKADRGDYVAAIHSLAEGEATCIERALDDPLRRGCIDPAIQQSFDQQRELGPDSLPPVIRRSLASPYVDGVHYVGRLLREGGWSAVEDAWRGRLQSTRQLFNDAEQKVEPLPIAEPQYEFGDCALRHVDLMGEQGLRNVVSDAADTDHLETVLESLTGERVALWQCSDLCVAVMRLRLRQVSAAHTLGRWLAESVGLSPMLGGPNCRALRWGAVGYYASGQDIAIASVLPCHGHVVANWADMCPRVSALSVHTAGL